MSAAHMSTTLRAQAASVAISTRSRTHTYQPPFERSQQGSSGLTQPHQQHSVRRGCVGLCFVECFFNSNVAPAYLLGTPLGVYHNVDLSALKFCYREREKRWS